MVPHGRKHIKPYADYAKDSIPAVRRRDRIKALAQRMNLLSVKAYRALTPEKRAEITRRARLMYDLGKDWGTAQRAESTVRCGFVYIISHPHLDGIKIGRAFDPYSRLSSYQTGCPYREYKLDYAVYFTDCQQAERDLHKELSEHRIGKGEWYAMPRHVAEEIIDMYKESENVG